MLYSLGFACRVRESIQRYLDNSSQQTNLFDWNLVNFATIVSILQKDMTFKSDDFYDTNEICMQSRIVNHKTLRFDTLHDFDIKQTYETILPVFLEKYNRRLLRLRLLISGTEMIDFIHLFDIYPNFRIPECSIYIPTVNEIECFFDAIYKINPNSKVRLHLLVPPNDCKYEKKVFKINRDLDELKINDKVYIHYLTQDDNNPVKSQCNHWSWFTVYDFIKTL